MVDCVTLYDAFLADDADKVQQLLAGSKFRWNEQFPGGLRGGESLAETAAYLGSVKVLRRLYEASPNNKDRSIPLIAAAAADRLEGVRLLLEVGCDPDVREGLNDEDDRGWTPLMHACFHRSAEMVELLLAAGADPNPVSKKGTCAAALLSQGNDLKLLILLVEKGCKVFGQAMIYAAVHGNPEMLKLLLAEGADMNVLGTDEEDLWEGYGVLECCLSVLAMKRSFIHAADRTNSEGVKVFERMSAEIERCYESVEILSTAGIDLNRVNHRRTPICWAIVDEDPRLVELLLKKGAPPDSATYRSGAGGKLKPFGPETYYYNSAIHIAVELGLAEIVKMLIEAKASLNKPDFHGKTPLVISMEKGFDAITALLRNAGGAS